ncbi:protein kinase domain-containing protein [Pseudoscourfieldia marina]
MARSMRSMRSRVNNVHGSCSVAFSASASSSASSASSWCRAGLRHLGRHHGHRRDILMRARNFKSYSSSNHSASTPPLGLGVITKPASSSSSAASAASYLLLSKLGSGGSADTFLARRLRDEDSPSSGGDDDELSLSFSEDDDENVVIKSLSLRRSAQWKSVELFEREAKTLASLNHEAIPRYVDFFQTDVDDDRGFYIVQSRAPGETLQELVARGYRPTDEELVHIAKQLLEVCEYLSSLRPPCIHRDIKPGNVLYDVQTKKVSLVDFGAVAAAAMSATAGSTAGGLGSTVVGTFGYMAPEQFQGGASTSTDLYGVGATLLYVLTSKSPDEWTKTRLRIDLKGVAMGPALARVIPALLEPFPEDRVRSAAEALALLDGTSARNGDGDGDDGDDGEDEAAQRAGVLGQFSVSGQFTRSTASSGAYVVGAPNLPTVANMPFETDTAALTPTRRRRRPSGARSTVERSDAQLRVSIPAGGLSGASGGEVAFSVAWNTFIAFWTVGAFTGGGIIFAAFSLPFWLAGAQMGGKAVRDIAMRTEMEVDASRFSVTRTLAGRDLTAFDGPTADLSPARLDTSIVVNGVPTYTLRLKCGVDEQPLGEGLDAVELEWLAGEINSFLAEVALID